MKFFVFILFAIIICSKGNSYAQNRPANPEDQITHDHPQPQAFVVQPKDIPTQVVTTLNSDLYKGWNTLGTYLIREEDGTVYYAIEMEKNGEKQTVTLDRDGYEVDRDVTNVLDEYEID